MIFLKKKKKKNKKKKKQDRGSNLIQRGEEHNIPADCFLKIIDSIDKDNRPPNRLQWSALLPFRLESYVTLSTILPRDDVKHRYSHKKVIKILS